MRAKLPTKVIDKNNPFGKKESGEEFKIKNMTKLFEQQ